MNKKTSAVAALIFFLLSVVTALHFYPPTNSENINSQIHTIKSLASSVATNGNQLLPKSTNISDSGAQNLGRTPAANKNDHAEEPTPHMKDTLRLASEMEHLSGPATNVDAEVEQLTHEITSTDASQLKTLALDERQSHSARYLAVSLMSERPEIFAPQLEEISKSASPVLYQVTPPHTDVEQQRHFEETLRVQALAGLDQLNKQGSREENFFIALATNDNPLVRKLARMGAVGARQGKTLINQYINVER